MVRLGNVSDIRMGQSPPSDTYNVYAEGLPFLQGKAEFTHLFPRPTKYCTKPLKVAEQGSVLISVRAPVGDTNMADRDYIIGRGLASISLRQGDNLYLFYQLLHSKDRIEAQGSGTTFQSINKATLDNFPILLPPLPEQRAIARTLRAVQDAIQARRREVTLERERKAALMQHLFTYGTRGEPRKQTAIGEMPQSWQTCEMHEIARVAYGLTVNASRRKEIRLAPYLTVANVTRGALRLDEVKQIGMMEGDSERYRVKKGDVLLIEGNGNPKLLGSAAVWNDELPFALHQNHLIRARPNQKVVLPEWLMGYINGDAGRAQLLGRAKTSSGLHSINSRLIASLCIPLPSILEQGAIVEIMRVSDAKIAALEQEAAALGELFQVTIEELMTGRLSALPLAEMDGCR